MPLVLTDRFELLKVLQRTLNYNTYEAKDLKRGLVTVVKLYRAPQHVFEFHGDNAIIYAQKVLCTYRQELEVVPNICVQELLYDGISIIMLRPHFANTFKSCLRYSELESTFDFKDIYRLVKRDGLLINWSVWFKLFIIEALVTVIFY